MKMLRFTFVVLSVFALAACISPQERQMQAAAKKQAVESAHEDVKYTLAQIDKTSGRNRIFITINGRNQKSADNNAVQQAALNYLLSIDAVPSTDRSSELQLTIDTKIYDGCSYETASSTYSTQESSSRGSKRHLSYANVFLSRIRGTANPGEIIYAATADDCAYLTDPKILEGHVTKLALDRMRSPFCTQMNNDVLPSYYRCDNTTVSDNPTYDDSILGLALVTTQIHELKQVTGTPGRILMTAPEFLIPEIANFIIQAGGQPVVSAPYELSLNVTLGVGRKCGADRKPVDLAALLLSKNEEIIASSRTTNCTTLGKERGAKSVINTLLQSLGRG